MARDSAFKLIYQIPFHGDLEVSDVMEIYASGDEYAKLTETDIEFVNTAVNSCFDNIEEIDSKINSSLKNWTINRISKVNLAILRLSISEMTYAEVPFQVSINEAVELAKKYSDDDAPAFVNGVLAEIIK